MESESIISVIAAEFGIQPVQVRNTVKLLDEGNTVPFIARYRKELTGSLHENVIRGVQERIIYFRHLVERKNTVLKTIAEQGKLTDDLRKRIEQTIRMQELEDLYLPFKPKRKTRASVAREKGLEPLAQLIYAQELVSGDVTVIAEEFVDPAKEVSDPDEALRGARDILCEIFSEDADVRKQMRELWLQTGILVSEARSQSADPVYRTYFDYRDPVRTIAPHRILAVNRGEKEEALKVHIDVGPEKALAILTEKFLKNPRSIFSEQIILAVEDAYQRLLAPAIQREIRSGLTERADEHAIRVFAVNLRQLLMQPPVLNKFIMGIDPGYRTGCKVAIIDATGKYVEGTTIYPHPPQREYFPAKSRLRDLIVRHGVEIIAIGNGTASRETELMTAELIKEIQTERELVYIVVSEAGASVYSASKIAQEEFPDLEAGMRGNISIARRLQDPLAELVKIDPKSIGVGLYQHDVDQKRLAGALHDVVESCVNEVGVDLNTASPVLLRYVAGLTERSARNIVAYRERHGRISTRDRLMKIEGIGPAAFQQCAGFLRIRGGDNTLDATAIHPESYPVTFRLLKKLSISDIHREGPMIRDRLRESGMEIAELAGLLNCGIPTLEDILSNLEKPGRDPRERFSGPVFRSDVLKIEDLKEEMILKGTVRNVVDFGAFVDIGVKQDGLVHVSKMGRKYVKNPHEVLHVGDTIDVRVLKVDIERGHISLSLITESQ